MYLLLIDTTTDLCSVALSKNGTLIDTQNAVEENNHAAALTLLIGNILTAHKLEIKEIAAVVISTGPGSYTGLRIGTATAKGLCFAASLPLISVSTLQALADAAAQQIPNALYLPMIDARRMEVYTALYSPQLTAFGNIEPLIVEADSLTKILTKNHFEPRHKTVICGNGAEKCKEVFAENDIVFLDIKCEASNLIRLATEKLMRKEFEDLAYFEPFYLKGANITVSKK